MLFGKLRPADVGIYGEAFAHPSAVWWRNPHRPAHWDCSRDSANQPPFKILRYISAAYVSSSIGAFDVLLSAYFGIVSLSYNVSRFCFRFGRFSLYNGAYIGEVVRAGIESVDHGQWEAATAMGMSYPQVLRYVILPKRWIMIPPAIGVVIAAVKGQFPFRCGLYGNASGGQARHTKNLRSLVGHGFHFSSVFHHLLSPLTGQQGTGKETAEKCQCLMCAM